MISGTKISQLPVVTVLQDTDYFPIARGATTNRISGLTLNSAALSAIKANFPINYTSGIFTLSSDNTILLQSNNIKLQTNLLALTGSQVIETNSLSAALRVTQTGFGDALVVEDSANPDSTSFVVTSSGNIGVGTLIPANKLHIHTTASSTATDAHIKLTQTSNSNESYITTDSSGFTRIGGVAGVGFVASTNQVVSVLSSGRVGVNTTTPNESLTVSGNISANTVYAYISGNSETTTKWQTPRLVTLSGATYGSTLLNGTQDVTIYTAISTGIIIDQNISDSANISDAKLAPISTPGKVLPGAIDYIGTQPGAVLMSTGSATVWQNLSSTEFAILPGSITTTMLGNNIVVNEKIADNAITTSKLSAGSVTTSKIADSAITTDKILDGSVTLAKTLAYADAIPNSLVSRDLSGNLSAVEVTANLKGNASTATSLQNPMTLQLAGDISGVVTFNGSQTAILTATAPSVPVWVVYAADIRNDLSATYIQGNENTESSFVTITQETSATKPFSRITTFLQEDDTITLSLSNITLSNQAPFLAYNLLTGTELSAVFTNDQAITGSYTPLPDGLYTIETVTPGFSSTVVTLSTSITQYASGDIQISFDEIFFYPEHNLQPGHIINIAFLTGVPLGSSSFVSQASGLYVVTEVPTTRSFTLSTSTFQSASGQILMYRCSLRDSYGVSNVTYIDVGNHLLNFSELFTSPFYYGFAGSATSVSLTGTGLFTSSIERDALFDYQDQLNLGIRTVLNNGSLSLYDFNRTHVICFGSR